MTTPYIAALRRKHDACLEPAKRAELAHALMVVGVDVNAVEATPEPVRAKSEPPVGRSTKPLVTAEPTKPVEVAENKETSKETAAKDTSPRRRPGRPRKTETSK